MLSRWWSEKKNWGDALNPILIEHISGIKPLNVNELNNYSRIKRYIIAYKYLKIKELWDLKFNPQNTSVYLVIGSCLNWYHDDNLVIWGPGFMRFSEKLHSKPKKICAVRGPLTRQKILKQGIDCPKIFGDPALLYPRYYRSIKKKKFVLGLIPHWSEQENFLINKFLKNSDVLLIDIMGGIRKFVDDICSCEYIASSALHGIIAADAYNVPSIWIELVNRADNFKFLDYFKSVGRIDNNPLRISNNTTIEDIYDYYNDYEINIDLDELLDACPFKK